MTDDVKILVRAGLLDFDTPLEKVAQLLNVKSRQTASYLISKWLLED